MTFGHATAIWKEHPTLVAGVLHVDGIEPDADVDAHLVRLQAVARERLDGSSGASFPEVQAWRRAFSRMGLEPTRYRSASEALLRRFRTEGSLPRIHPLVDLCNATSLAFAIPVAVFDLDRVTGDLEVRPATGDETSLSFRGEPEHPDPGEVIFADADRHAHARRWSHRQSGASAVRPGTRRALIVAEAMHDDALRDVEALLSELAPAIADAWGARTEQALLRDAGSHFDAGSRFDARERSGRW